jgi:hypothetical protein
MGDNGTKKKLWWEGNPYRMPVLMSAKEMGFAPYGDG